MGMGACQSGEEGVTERVGDAAALVLGFSFDLDIRDGEVELEEEDGEEMHPTPSRQQHGEKRYNFAFCEHGMMLSRLDSCPAMRRQV